MAKISAAQVKELRDKTGVGMMDAKKALVETEGDIKKAVDVLREKGVAKAEKKSGRVAAEGIAAVAIKDNKAAIVEINCETDSVASTDKFKNLVTEVADKIAEEEPASVDDALALKTANGTVKDDVIETTQVTGEKISLRRFQVVEKGADQSFGSYIHNGGQIAALVVLDGADSATAKDVAMHVAAINPEYVNREQVPADRLAHEKDVLVKEALNEGKPEKIVEKMVEGRLNKWLSEISLDDQEFVKDSDQTVAHFVESKGGKVSSFIRFEVGEGIEKKADNFIDEVMNQIKD